ncbi:hypothetical protein GW17_00001824 [Ensete ventricosum]|nr:hypothetical protein GW17_00001824 [Ensete ventricosum]
MGPRALHEYQFIPEQPSVWPEALDRVSQSHYLESSADAPNIKMTSLPSGGRYLHVNDHEGSSYTFHGQILSAGLLTQEGWQRAFPSVSVEYDNSLHGSSFPDPATDAQFAMSEVPGLESPYLSPYRRLDRKRKAEKLRQKEELRREKEAARLEAARERATARRIAKEYTELIEDERLELMELAAANKGLSSIYALDTETLQQLDSFRSTVLFT